MERRSAKHLEKTRFCRALRCPVAVFFSARGLRFALSFVKHVSESPRARRERLSHRFIAVSRVRVHTEPAISRVEVMDQQEG